MCVHMIRNNNIRIRYAYILYIYVGTYIYHDHFMAVHELFGKSKDKLSYIDLKVIRKTCGFFGHTYIHLYKYMYKQIYIYTRTYFGYVSAKKLKTVFFQILICIHLNFIVCKLPSILLSCLCSRA